MFRARRIATAELENALPLFGTSKSVSIDVGENATLKASSMYLIAQAEDRSFATLIGADRLTSTFAIAPLLDKAVDLTALPIKVLVKFATRDRHAARRRGADRRRQRRHRPERRRHRRLRDRGRRRERRRQEPALQHRLRAGVRDRHDRRRRARADQRRGGDQPHLGRDRERVHHHRDRARPGRAEGPTRSSRSRPRWRSATRW